MSIRAVYSVFCDECIQWVGGDPTRKQAAACAISSGWLVKRNKHLCPKCAKKAIDAAKEST